MTASIGDLPVEILRHLALYLDQYSLRSLQIALPNGSLVFDSVFKFKYYKKQHPVNSIWAAFCVWEDEEYLFKLLLADDVICQHWVASQVFYMQLDLSNPVEMQNDPDYVVFGSDYDPEIRIGVDSVRDICYAPISAAIEHVNMFLPKAFELLSQFDDIATSQEWVEFFRNLSETILKVSDRATMYFPILARVFMSRLVADFHDEDIPIQKLMLLYNWVCKYGTYVTQPLILYMVGIPIQDYEEVEHGFYQKFFEENVDGLLLDEICESIAQNRPRQAPDTIAKMELFFSYLDTDDMFKAGASLANMFDADKKGLCEWINNYFKNIDKIKWRQVLSDVKWNLHDTMFAKRKQVVIDLLTDNQINLFPLFVQRLSVKSDDYENNEILVTLLKSVISNGEKTDREANEILMDICRRKPELNTTIAKVKRYALI
jgi:hypothetical protein